MEIPFSASYQPGSWNWRTDYGGLTYFTCPDCGDMGVLDDHVIHDDGRVEPSVVCPNDYCSFHEAIHLLEWPIMSNRKETGGDV